MLPCEAWTDTIEEKLRSRRRSWDVDVDVDVDVAMVCNSVRKWDLQMCCWAVMVQKTEHKCDLDCVQYASILALPPLVAPTAVCVSMPFLAEPSLPARRNGQQYIQVTTNKDSMMPICAAKSGK